MTRLDAAPSLREVTERFSSGEPVLAAGILGSSAVVALAAASVSASDLRAIRRLGGDTLILGLGSAQADQLGIPELPCASRAIDGLRMLSPIDAADSNTAGWTLAAQAHTMQVASQRDSQGTDLTIPGHVHAARIEEGGYTAPQVALELARAAGGAAVIMSRVLDPDGQPVSLERARRLPGWRELVAVPTGQLVANAARRGSQEEEAGCALPSVLGSFRIVASESRGGDETVMTLVYGEGPSDPIAPVHTHIRCLLGDTFGGHLCDCRSRLDDAIADIVGYGAGALIYVYPARVDPFYCPGSEESTNENAYSVGGW